MSNVRTGNRSVKVSELQRSYKIWDKRLGFRKLVEREHKLELALRFLVTQALA